MFTFILKAFSKESDSDVPEKVIGIDLGTTFSCVGIFQNGKVDIIPNEVGNRITPSIVAFNNGEVLVGDSSLPYVISNPQNTVYTIKRLIGRRFLDKEVQKEINRLPYKVVDYGNNPRIEIETSPGHKELKSPEEISALILAKMKSVAETYLGEEVKSAVITVPAYFNDAQRKATKDAGAIAGLNVRRIINEPTAAAIAYGLDRKDDKKILVYDLGGGTFDVSLLQIEDSFFEVLATAGDTHLGGEDFDNRIVDHFLDIFKRRTGKDARSDHKAVARLKRECERAKRALSTSHQTRIEIDNFYDGESLNEPFTRARFEELNMDLFKKTMKPVHQVLKDAGVSKHEIDEIVLVGGSTRTPKVQELVREYFNGKMPCTSINPDEAVAYGAAVEGAQIGGMSDDKYLIMNVNPLTLGIETVGGVMTELIPRNTHIPVEKKQNFSTAADDQELVRISVFEGERAMTRDNHFLGQFDLTGLPPGPRGSVQIEVTFSLDENNILTVSAVDTSSGNKQEIKIDQQNNEYSSTYIEDLINQADNWKEDDMRRKATALARNELDNQISIAKRELEKPEWLNKVEEVKTYQEVLKEYEDWLESSLDEEEAAIQQQIKELRSRLSDVFSKAERIQGGLRANDDDEEVDFSGDEDIELPKMDL